MENKNKQTRIVMMSPALMRLYDVYGIKGGSEFQPITFCLPQECLEMLVSEESLDEDENSLEPAAETLERKMGELELRLSFFTNAQKWQ